MIRLSLRVVVILPAVGEPMFWEGVDPELELGAALDKVR
jgi:hypothetical protein